MAKFDLRVACPGFYERQKPISPRINDVYIHITMPTPSYVRSSRVFISHIV